MSTQHHGNDISQWNLEAINLLQRGNARGATALLGNALRMLGAHVRAAEAQGRRAPAEMVSSLRSVAVALDCVGQLADPEISDEILPLFPKVFELPDSISNDDCARILLYNMAIACEVHALQAGSILTALEWTHKAVHFYQCSLQIGGDILNGDTRTEVNMVVLATTNNLSRLFSYHHCFQETRACLLLSLEVMNRLADAGDCPEEYLLQFKGVTSFMCLDEFILTAAPVA